MIEGGKGRGSRERERGIEREGEREGERVRGSYLWVTTNLSCGFLLVERKIEHCCSRALS